MPVRTPPFRGPKGEVLPGSIAETGTLHLGGLEQWVMIRGENIKNPLLILLQGGPGFPEMRLFRHFNASLEKYFTVVYWEQRGTDHSFSAKIPKSSMTIERFIADLDELVDRLCRRFGKEQVVLYGHSWGSALGVLYAARFPEKVAAYVGSGQIGDWGASEAAAYAFTLSEAERRGNKKALKQLRAIGAPPHTTRQMMVQRKWHARFAGIARGMSFLRFFRITLSSPESSLFRLPKILRGQIFSANAMWPEISSVNLVEAVPALDVPVFFFIGRHDCLVSAEISAAYFETLRAPSKKLIWFENSAHVPPVEEPEKFNMAMVEWVRPIAISYRNVKTIQGRLQL